MNVREINEDVIKERSTLLQHVSELLDTPMIFLSFIWVILVGFELTIGEDPLLEKISVIIWGVFVFDFILEFIIAPKKLKYIRNNWITTISLLLPAFRILRILKGFKLLHAARAIRSIRLVRILTSINRAMKTIRNVLKERGIGYITLLTVIIAFAGAAGMYYFENPAAVIESGYQSSTEEVGLKNYGDALWWTAMLLTTIGSDYWPKTLEGRVLTWLLSLYAFSIFGYITATIASFLIGKERKELNK